MPAFLHQKAKVTTSGKALLLLFERMALDMASRNEITNG
jgi:hypothetical protein